MLRTPRHVARWRRRPVLWSALLLVVWGLVLVDNRTLAAVEPRFAERPPVTATIEDTDRGWATVTVTYTDPITGLPVRDTLDVYDMRLFPDEGTATVRIELAPGTVREARLAGDAVALSWNVDVLALALSPLAWLVMRARHVRATGRRINDDQITFRMLGRVQTGRSGRPPTLALWPLDARPGDEPVCAVRLIRHAPDVLTSTAHYDVKGSPRPFGVIVARDARGNVLWPAGRALGWTRQRFEPAEPPLWPAPPPGRHPT